MSRIAMIPCQQWSTTHLCGGVEVKLDYHSDVTNITWLTNIQMLTGREVNTTACALDSNFLTTATSCLEKLNK